MILYTTTDLNIETAVAYCDGLTWLRAHEDGGAAMVYVDPPYGHGYFGNVEDEWVFEVIREAYRVAANDGIVYLHTDPEQLYGLVAKWGQSLPKPRGVIAWKNGWASGYKARSTKFWPRTYHLIVGYAKTDWKLRPVQRPKEEYKAARGRTEPTPNFVYSDWWETPSPVGGSSFAKKTGWPTEKPIALLDRLIRGSTDAGDVVMDPTCGSGTTLIAAARTGRLGFGADLSGSAVEIAQARLEAEGATRGGTTASENGRRARAANGC